MAESSIGEHDAAFFFSLAHWAKENDVLRPWERRLIFSIGMYISNGWQISKKQGRQALRIMQIATQAGFHKGTGDQIAETSLVAQLVAKSHQLRIPVEMLGLTPGILMGLKRNGINTIEKLSKCSEADLLGMYIIGPSRLKGIKTTLNQFLSRMLSNAVIEEQASVQSRVETARATKQLIELANCLCQVFETYGLLNDLRLPSEAQSRLYKATGEKLETLADLRRLIESPNCKAHIIHRGIKTNIEIDDIEPAIHWFSEVLICKSVDDEMKKLVGHLTERERFVFINRSSIDKHLTLEEIGHELRVTRERVRQIEVEVNRKLGRQLTEPLPFFYSSAALLLLKRLGQDATVELWKEKLLNVGFLKEETSLDLLTALARVTKAAPLVLSEELARLLKTHVPPRILSASKPILSQARKHAKNCGAVRIVSIKPETLSEADVEQILFLDGFTEVRSGWWAKDIGDNIPMRIARKVITYCGPVSASSLRKAVAKHLSRGQLFAAPPSDVLVKALMQTKQFDFTDGLLHLTKVPSKKPKINKGESVFFELVRSKGPIVSFESMRTRLIEEGLSAAYTNALISFSPIVERVISKLYILTGTQYDMADIERAKSELTEITADPTIRPRPDGIIEFEINIGTMTVHSHVLSSGPAARLEGDWAAVVEGTYRGKLIVGDGFIRGSGFSNAVLNLGIVAGDRMRIEFNTWTREARISRVFKL